MKVLLVDDDELFRVMISVTLKAAGYQVTVASNGDEAIKEARLDDYDLIITDIFMPNKDGMEVIQKIKAMRPAIKIIAMSSSGSAEFTSFKIARSLGSNGSLQKPFSPAELLAKVKEVTVNKGKAG